MPWRDAPTIGNLLGTRMALNEFVAYSQLGPMKASLDPRSFTIATFALCGFANFSSIGIQIGGIGALAPTRRHDLARLGLRAMLAGTLANFITATIAGLSAVMADPDYVAGVERAAAWLRAAASARRPTSRSCWARASATSPRRLSDPVVVPYADIPHWPASTVVGHAGTLVVGTLAGRRVAALSGRAHFYEGHDSDRRRSRRASSARSASAR